MSQRSKERVKDQSEEFTNISKEDFTVNLIKRIVEVLQEKPQEEPNLKPVPDPEQKAPFSYCSRRGNQLFVTIMNHGGDMPTNPNEFTVQVNFQGSKDQPKDEKWPAMKGGEATKELPFDIPKDLRKGIFNFNINIFMGGILHNQTKGTCRNFGT